MAILNSPGIIKNEKVFLFINYIHFLCSFWSYTCFIDFQAQNQQKKCVSYSYQNVILKLCRPKNIVVNKVNLVNDEMWPFRGTDDSA